MHNGSQYASTTTPSNVRPHTSDRYICTHCDMPHDDSVHISATTHNLQLTTHNSQRTMVRVTSPTVDQDKSTQDNTTHSLESRTVG